MIGKKKHSSDNICVKWGLKWGSSRFKLLGIKFSVDLEDIEKLNYDDKIRDIEKCLKSWYNQKLSPIGKITVIKTLIISKLNYLFLTLPQPNTILLNKLISELYKFIWDGNPDKINRKTLSKDYHEGGLKMPNIHAYIKGLKLTWIRRAYTSTANVYKLLTFSENLDFNRLCFLGPEKQLKNRFWNEVFEAWKEFKDIVEVNEDNIGSTSIWNNENIKVANVKVIYNDWINKGVLIVDDLLLEDNTFMSFQEFKNKFNINTNFLIYHGLISAIKKFHRNMNNKLFKKCIGPVMPLLLKSILDRQKGSKNMYKILNCSKHTLLCEQKWNIMSAKNYNWKVIHQTPFKTTKSSKLQWFQYRIIHRILATNDFLHKIKKKENDKCTFCKVVKETIEHVFWSCPISAQLWEDLNNWIFQQTNLELPINFDFVLFGFLQKSQMNYVRNIIILLSKYYIYKTKLEERNPNINALKNYLRENLYIEKHIYMSNNSIEKTQLCWNPWNSLLE